ncbi:conjugal transfer protein TraC [Candidatus Uhrbacteria bacterium CG_4_9_14_0_2_um_filter_41_50]|uniref:Conjugal transfer protein TraC n=1 Tax=Candidatus Uhrbacteria bacterium CG_4_9_14_0_2_um_filter_41_50 TaxID=1975031 RepID=A0A2M8EQJ2_9BACT|nr:MAG: conjugal transfer protein TraC [Candidatus Uhrbacteria bacterium CG_4_10_14_3_um_filter_41_21]PIZ55492.1 MAG: conjugal transfer protein TraC [Candidatus Uhrbacteria bacterium CG_4_10_14_0_2_um_filter_41_21]PJB84696.1 MAG: conjugal transfer protein TraC [Candidatus Uhrbacteria bacterium CG_4_9_14_0_8_um_filter_41_16]PJC24947.1 MAG: conjugal transfer protein TraC [Candidatus Uhrbacteria bacterium CG_4_9_14_0_2_um_filter_41_50]PJE74683.1 MAG: conjugal transfer protein TraC [Candidatus Uhrb
MAIDVKKLERDEGKKPEKEPVKLTSEQEKILAQKKTLEEERTYRQGTVTVRDLIAPASFQVNPDFLKIGDKFIRTMFIVTYPRYVNIGWGAPIINYNGTLDIGMFFYPIPSEVILKQLKDKVGVLEAQIISDNEKGAPRDPIRETALRDVEQLRDDLTQGIEHFFQFAFYITLYADNKEDLDRRSGQIESIFGSKLIYTKRGFYQSEQGFNSTMPLGNDELMISFNMSTSPIASSFPFISSDLSSDKGIMYGINRHNNSLILFDRFSLQNANAVVFATSGAGKSYAVKLEILRSLMMGSDVIVIDPEMEYRTLSDAVGGTYVNVSLASESKINPFDLPRAVGEGTSVEDILRSAVITIKGLLRIMIGQPLGQSDQRGFTPAEDSTLDRAIIEAYAKKDITPDLENFDGVEYPILQDLQEILDGMEGAGDLVDRLRKYTEGTFSGLLNSPTTVEMKNSLVTFSVRDLEDELRPMAIYTIVNYIWNVVRSERKKRILAIDEAWWLMQHDDSAKFIFALVKRARKYFLGVTTITQDVNDFLRNPYGQAIVTNSSLQLLMKQSPAGVDIVSETFNLTQSEKYLLLEAGVGEGIFFAGNKHAAIKVVASYTEDQLITTNPEQLLEIERARKEFEESFGGGENK